MRIKRLVLRGIIGALAILVGYLVWGLLDYLGGTKPLFDWFASLPSLLGQPSFGSFCNIWGQCTPLTAGFWALYVSVPVLFFGGLALAWLIEKLTQSSPPQIAPRFEEFSKREEQKDLIKEAIREVLDERELEERRRKDKGA